MNLIAFLEMTLLAAFPFEKVHSTIQILTQEKKRRSEKVLLSIKYHELEHKKDLTFSQTSMQKDELPLRCFAQKLALISSIPYNCSFSLDVSTLLTQPYWTAIVKMN